MINISLLYPDDRKYDLDHVPGHADRLALDLELPLLFKAMARDDKTVDTAVRQIILGQRSTEISVIIFRQQIQKDFIRYTELLAKLYQLSMDTLGAYRESLRFWLSAKSASRRLRSNLDILDMLLTQLSSVRDLGESYPALESSGLKKFFRFLQRYYDDETLHSLRAQITTLRMDNGFSVSAKLDHNNRSQEFFLNRDQPSTHWLKNWFPLVAAEEGYSFTIAQRDESGLTALAEFRDAALEPVARLMDSAVHQLLDFFTRLRDEAAFYRGALNLRAALEAREYPLCWPVPLSSQPASCVASRIYDPCLALAQEKQVITNDLQASNKSLLIITGANSGGKSTFLRALGVNQLLMQCGLATTAQEFSASICDEVYTHFKLEEDASMHSGKFEEELLRMADLVPQLKATAMLLFNESFAATNEREGAEIAWQICTALLEKGIKIIFVTHLYTFAQRCYAQQSGNILALRAPSDENLSMKYKLSEAEPLNTSFAKDVYNRIFEYKNK